MAWTAPATWTAHTAPSAADLNEQLRDNFDVLKTVRDATGKLSALSSATLADLSPANLTGLASAAGANQFSAGRTRLTGTTRVVVPVGADKWSGTKGVDAAGVWVEGDYLHHIASNFTTEYRYLGDSVSTPAGAVVGSLWVEGNDLHYIDESGVERKAIFSGTTTVHTDAAALGGSWWVETYQHVIRESGSLEKPLHADVTHADHSDHNDYTDHGDSGPHTDHSDHTDGDYTPHEDASPPHDDHYDLAYHGDHDDHSDHTDYGDHADHGDTGTHTDHDDHSDGTPHSDVLADNRPVTV